MINLIHELIEEIPVLHVVQASLQEEELPTVFYLHGYNGEKISSLTQAYMLAEKGYRVILPDAIHHGERKQGLGNTELQLAFWDIVVQSIHELDVLKNNLTRRGYTLEDRIGVAGTSMGAITTYGAVATYDWITAAASLMGTAYMTDYAKGLIGYYNQSESTPVSEKDATRVLDMLQPYDLSLQHDKLHQRPLLIWHGEADEVVPYLHSPKMYEQIKAYYDDISRLRFVGEKGRSHHISRLSMKETTDWFIRFV